tara:strand:- start:40 stop:1266 length:1227 start_codon:yes stop_codon:yes gene_type:complete
MSNYLDIDGFDWLSPAPNTSIVSMISLLNEAMFYRRINLDPKLYTLAKPTPYRQFEYFINTVNQCMSSHEFLNPLYIGSSLANLELRVEYIRVFEPFASDSLLCVLATTIYNWEDLENIIGEDLTELKDEKLRVNEVWSTNLLTKMYKIVSAFSFKIQNGGSHLIGDFIDRDTYIDFNSGQTQYTAPWIASDTYYNSYSTAQENSIKYNNTNSYNEFINNISIRQPKDIQLTTQIRDGALFDPDNFPSRKSWDYQRRSGRISDGVRRYEYELNFGFSCPLNPKFSRGNSTNTYLNQTEYYQYGNAKNIDNIDFYEYFYFHTKTDNSIDFGSGINLFDGGVLKYNHNSNSTLQTDVFANFDYTNGGLLEEFAMDGVSFYTKIDSLVMESRTYADINNNPYNEYKTTDAP